MSGRGLLAALLCLLGAPLGLAQEPDKPLYMIVAPHHLGAAVQPLVSHRDAAFTVVAAELSSDRAHSAADIAERLRRRRPAYVLLVGDSDDVPGFDVLHPGSKEAVTTDRPYGDWDGDGFPEASVGRIPFGEAETVSRVVRRIIDYETKLEGGRWRKELALIAGEARYSPAIDKLIEDLFARVVSQGVDEGYDVDLTYANPRSRFCYPPDRFADRVAERLSESPLVMAYVGHGQERSVDSLTVGQPGGRKKRYEVLSSERARTLQPQASAAAPVFLAIACWTGRYEAKAACIGEELLASPGGPVAFFGSSRISHPVHNALLAKELVREVFSDTGEVRLGPALDRARRAMSEGRPGVRDPVRLQILAMAQAFVGADVLKVEMPRHVDMYNLLGDPALVLARPESTVQVSATRRGSDVDVRGQLDGGYRMVTVTLESSRTGSARPEAEDGETDLERYARANDKVLATRIVPVEAGAFRLRVPAPEGKGPWIVKAFAQSNTSCATGGTTLP